MKLTKSCELVLDEIKKLKPDNNGIYYTVRYVAENAELDMRYDVFLGILRTLANENFIFWGNHDQSAFALNEAGRSYEELKMLDSRERWQERVYGFLFGFALWAIPELIQWLIQLKT